MQAFQNENKQLVHNFLLKGGLNKAVPGNWLD